jgi:hypothetical protein
MDSNLRKSETKASFLSIINLSFPPDNLEKMPLSKNEGPKDRSTSKWFDAGIPYFFNYVVPHASGVGKLQVLIPAYKAV